MDPGTLQRFDTIDDNFKQVFDRLGKIETRIASLAERNCNSRDLLENHHTVLFGPPEDGDRPGLIARVTRIEGANKLFIAGFGAVWGIVAVILTAWVVSCIT